MSSAKKIVQNTGFLFTTEIFDKFLSFIFIIIITRYLGSVGFGKYSFAFAFVSMFTILYNLGINTYIFREISKDKSKTNMFINNTFTFRLVLSIITFMIAAIVAQFWSKSSEIFWAIVLVMIYNMFTLFYNIIRVVFQAYEQNQFVLYSTIIEKTFVLILSYILLSSGFGLYMTILAVLFSGFTNALYCYIVARKKFIKISLSFEPKVWMNLLKNGFPFWFTSLFQRIYYRIDTLMLTGMKSYAVTGLYNASSNLVAALSFIPMVIINATFPAMSRFHHTNSIDHLKLLYKKTSYYLLSIGIPISIGASLLAVRIIQFIYNEEFLESGVILMILSWSLVFVFVNHAIGYFLNSINKQHLFTISSGICAISNVILNLILIPKFSYIGAAFATVTTQIINFLALYYFTYKNKYPINIIKLSYKPIIAGIMMGALIVCLKFLPLVYLVPLAASAYVIILVLIGGVGKEEIKLIKSLFEKVSRIIR